MRAVIQRVLWAHVIVDGKTAGRCGRGLVVLVAAHRNDTEREAKKMADKIFGLRIFNDADGKMNISLKDMLAGPEGKGMGVLAVSNFTIYGDTAKNRRPSFIDSAPYDEGEKLFNVLVEELRALGCSTQTGVFGADMKVSIMNDGPVTLIVDVAPT